MLIATIKGRGGHAAMPHDCVDPIPVACEIVPALQTFIARQVPVADPAVLTIAKIEAGTTHNIIPGEAKLLGTLRTLSEETRANLQAAVRRFVNNHDPANCCEGEVVHGKGYQVTMDADGNTWDSRGISWESTERGE